MQLKWLQEALPGVLYRCSSVCTDWCRARGRLPLVAPRGGWTNGNGWGSRRWIAIGWNVGTCGVTTFTKWSTAKQHTVTFFRTCCSLTISQTRLPPRCERSVGQRDGMATRKRRGGNSSWSWVSSSKQAIIQEWNNHHSLKDDFFFYHSSKRVKEEMWHSTRESKKAEYMTRDYN